MIKSILLLLLLVCCSKAYTVSGNTYTTDGSQTDVQAAVNAAPSGSIVVLPSGTFTWSSGVSINASITICGSNFTPSTETGCTSPGSPSLSTTVIFPGSSSSNTAISVSSASSGTNSLRISGIDFQGVVYGNYYYIKLNGSKTSDFYRIDNCTFDGGNVAVIMLLISGNGPGLIDHCTLIGGSGSEMIHNQGTGAGNLSGWLDDIVPGSSSFLYIEDCRFDRYGYATAVYQYATSAIQSYYGSRNVVRYNLLNYCLFDQHGNIDSNARWWEFYNNQIFIPASNRGSVIFANLRGGSGVVFGNTLASGSQTSIGAIIDLYTDEASSNNLIPVVNGQQPGYGPGAGIFSGQNTSQGPTSSPVYIWGNDTHMSIGTNVGVGGWNPSPILPNEEYYVSTDEPSSMVISEAAAQIGGSTYQYTPYTYPHPKDAAIQPAHAPYSTWESSLLSYITSLGVERYRINDINNWLSSNPPAIPYSDWENSLDSYMSTIGVKSTGIAKINTWMTNNPPTP